MELALLAGLGALGWGLSAKGAASRDLAKTPPVSRPPNEFPFAQNTTVAGLLADDVDKAKKHVMRVYDPATGKYKFDTERVGHGELPPPQPYVRSDKSASTDTQQRVELFTGSDATWRHKRTLAPVFRPEEKRVPVGFGGSAKSARPLYDEQELKDRQIFGGKMNNVLPFEQVRVGPGLGVGPDVPATDGYQSRFRVLPTEALNAHRINQLPGIAPIGGVQRGFDRGARRIDNFREPTNSLVDLPPAITGAKTATNAPSCLPEPDLKPTRAEGTSTEYYGIAHRDVGTMQRVKTHVRKTQSCALPRIGETVTVKAPKLAEVNLTRKRRRRAGELPKMADSVVAKAPMETAIETTRTGNQCLGPMAMTGGGHAVARGTGQIPGAWVMGNPNRGCDAPGVTGGFVGGGATSRPCELNASGLRESCAVNAGGSSYLKKASMTARYNLGRGRETEARTELGGLSGGLFQEQPGLVRRRIKPNAYDEPPAAGIAPNAPQRAPPGTVVSKRKVCSEDPRTATLGLGLFGC